MGFTKKTVRAAILIVMAVLIAATAVQANADEKYTKEQLQKMYSDFLAEEGYRPRLDSDGDVKFKHDGRFYFIPTSTGDQNFFTIVLPNIWPIESQEEFERVLKASNYSNSKSKASKVFTIQNNVWISTEQYLTSPDKFKDIFETSIGALDNGFKIDKLAKML